MTSKRQLQAALDQSIAETLQARAVAERIAGHRNSLAQQTWSLRQQVEQLERDIAEWRALACDNYRRYIDAKDARPIRVIDAELVEQDRPALSLVRGRDDRGRFVKAEAAS